MRDLQQWHIRLFSAYRVWIDRWWTLVLPTGNPFWRLYHNEQAGAVITTLPGNGTPLPLEAGRVYLIPAGVGFQSRCEGPVDHLYAHFDVIGVPRPVMAELFSRPIPLPEDALHLSLMAERLRKTLGPPEEASGDAAANVIAAQCRVTGLIYEALACCLEEASAEERARWLRRVTEQEPVRPALEHIATHLGERLPVTQLASLCYLSEDYFIRRFRECVGVTPTQYILEQRIREAARRLLFTEDSVDRIVSDMGFGSRHYFTRVFKRQIGLAPAAYRKLPPF